MMTPGEADSPEAGGLPPGCRLVRFTSVGSTNDEARRLALAGAADQTWVIASRQEQGRGRRGRHWESPEGNLYCSVILRPPVAVAEAAQLSFVAAVALRDAVAAVLPPSAAAAVALKWPNDLLIHGRKAAGMLLEAEPGQAGVTVILGIGVNLQHFPIGTEYPATALAEAAGGSMTITPDAMLNGLAWRFAFWYERWLAEGFAPIRTGWLAAAHGLGAILSVRLADQTLHGRFVALDPSGALILELPGGHRSIMAGDVFFRRPGDEEGR